MIKDSNYITVQGWMINHLDLKPNEVLIYAVIFGFSQDGNGCFDGSLSYLCAVTKSTKPTVISALKKLVDQGLVIKTSEVKNNLIFNTYKANMDIIEIHTTVKNFCMGYENNLNGTGKNSLPNNNSNNNKDSSVSKGSKIFIPPTLQEVLDYFKEKGYNEESGKRAFDYYQAGSWKDGKGDQVKNWKQKMIAVWFKEENKIKETSQSKLIL